MNTNIQNNSIELINDNLERNRYVNYVIGSNQPAYIQTRDGNYKITMKLDEEDVFETKKETQKKPKGLFSRIKSFLTSSFQKISSTKQNQKTNNQENKQNVYTLVIERESSPQNSIFTSIPVFEQSILESENLQTPNFIDEEEIKQKSNAISRQSRTFKKVQNLIEENSLPAKIVQAANGELYELKKNENKLILNKDGKNLYLGLDENNLVIGYLDDNESQAFYCEYNDKKEQINHPCRTGRVDATQIREMMHIAVELGFQENNKNFDFKKTIRAMDNFLSF